MKNECRNCKSYKKMGENVLKCCCDSVEDMIQMNGATIDVSNKIHKEIDCPHFKKR